MQPILAGALVLVLALSQAGSASAQEDIRETAAARALFEQGVARLDAQDLIGAEDLFRRSLALRSSSAVRFNLASVLSRVGQLVEARELFRRVAVDDAVPQQTRDAAMTAAEDLAPRIATLVIVPPTEDDLRVSLDDEALPAALLGVPVPIDPGPHTVTATRMGQDVFREELTLDNGAQGHVEVRATAPEVEGDVAVPAVAASPQASGDDGWVIGLVVGVLAAALAAGGIVLGVVLTDDGGFTGNVGPGRIVVGSM